MLADLDRLMSQRNLDLVIVPMHEAMHASFRWITRGAKLTKGFAVKAAGHEPLLIAYPMERDEASASGLAMRLVDDFGHDQLFASAPTPAAAFAEFYARIGESFGTGRNVGIFGNAPVHLYAGIVTELEARGWSVYRGADDVIQLARKTKDALEVAKIEQAAARTEAIVDAVRARLGACDIRDGILRENGAVLTLGHLKTFVTEAIGRAGMIEDHETILSQGRDAGVPHSRGDANAAVRAGVPIVLDIFPADRDSGYFCDITRTFCPGEVPPRLREIYDAVHAAFELAASRMKPGTKAREYQDLVCDYFESRGYATNRSKPGTHDGYVHSLGHGVGLNIHERPFFSLLPSNQDGIEEGDIVTIEPGLYFPDEEIGVRIEDTFLVTADGVRSLCNSTRKLEL